MRVNRLIQRQSSWTGDILGIDPFPVERYQVQVSLLSCYRSSFRKDITKPIAPAYPFLFVCSIWAFEECRVVSYLICSTLSIHVHFPVLMSERILLLPQMVKIS